MAPDQSVVWYRLGNAYIQSARIQTDAAERTKEYNEAYTDLQKAVDLEQKQAQAQPAPSAGAKTPQTSGQQGSAPATAEQQRLAAFYDNLGAAAAAVGKPDEATTDYQKAADLDPANAANYYFRMGVTLHNTAKDTEGKKKAAEAFDKAIAADPNKADAYFLKGSDLFALVTTDSQGKMVPAPGTTEALQKYLEIAPTGPHAEEAKQMLAALNTSIETSYGTKKSSTTKKK
jgi:tetratricopeptide (TPR) repeat protein